MARTILVADDSPTIQNKAKGILTGEGLEVVTVSNGVAAMKKLPSVNPLVVLADVAMPGRDGYEVCDFVKNSPELRHVPVVLIFSEDEPYDERRGAQVGADGRIKKRPGTREPFDSGELISLVNKFVVKAEAAAPKPKLAPEPEPAIVTEPVDEEPEIGTRGESPVLSAIEGLAFAEPALEEVFPAPGWSPLAHPPEPLMEAEISAVPSPVAEAPLAAAEPIPAVPPPEETPLPTEPVLVEEPVAAVPEPAPVPPAEQTMVFRAPAQIAEPILSDELAPPPPAVEPPPAAAAPEEVAPVAATTLESFSLAEAAAGQVHFAAPEAEAAPPAEVEAGLPEPVTEVVAPPPSPQLPDLNLIYAIVHRVVNKMLPPSLPPQAIEDVAKKLNDEIIAELNLGSSQTQ